jgi:hypothetical protein
MCVSQFTISQSIDRRAVRENLLSSLELTKELKKLTLYFNYLGSDFWYTIPTRLHLFVQAHSFGFDD